MGQGYLLDANVLIDYTANLLPDNGKQKITGIIDDGFNISVVVKIEVLGYDDLPSKMKQLEAFLDLATVFPLDSDVTAKTIHLRRMYKKLKLGDAIIAATALAYNFALVTRNKKDFKNIEGLEVTNPYEL
jgi:predicted nucleic acid-binding protein